MPSSNKPTYIDLFAGCGGLSAGLERAGWRLAFAVEKSPMAASTFYHNLIVPIETSSKDWIREYTSKPLLEQIKNHLVVRPVSDILDDELAVNRLRQMNVDLVAGGPPCQGFSMAGRRKSDDIRNELAWDFLDIVKAANPKFVVIENVLGMNRKFKALGDMDSAYERVAKTLSQINDGYIVSRVMANALHYGAAQSRPRLLLVACRKDIAAKLSLRSSEEIWRSNFADEMDMDSLPSLAPVPSQIHPGSTVRDALADLLGGKSAYVESLKDSKAWGFLQNPREQKLQNHNVRSHGNRAKTKFALLHLLHKYGLHVDLMKNFEGDSNSEKARKEKLNDLTNSINFPIDGGEVLGSLTYENFCKLLEDHKTKKRSQRIVKLDEPAPTVMTSPDDFVHPQEVRVFTVRELARFQGFPDSFRFRSKETTGGLKRRTEVPQFTQVGNAVSPFLSFAIGARLINILKLAE